MARLQILELPAGPDDDRPPFMLVIDQYQPLRCVEVTADGHPQVGTIDEFAGVADKVGALAVLTFRETVEIPANGAAIGSTRATETEGLKCADVPDCDGDCCATGNVEKELKAASEVIKRLTADREEARQWARHGYEIGQRHCGWSDHGVAPAWLTEGWPPHIDSCEHLKQMAEFDEALTRVLEVASDLEALEAHGGAWDASQQAARLIRRAVGRPREEEAKP
jgi:hypothetical protein